MTRLTDRTRLAWAVKAALTLELAVLPVLATTAAQLVSPPGMARRDYTT